MGCAASSVDREERVQLCRERRKLMKQLLGLRGEFSNAVMAYLRALKNTGATLRQFTESESSELENIPFSSGLPPSPPLPLPPSPPPPPPLTLSPDGRKLHGREIVREDQEEIIEIGEDSDCTPPPPPAWDLWDYLEKSSVQHQSEDCTHEEVDEDNWAETRSQFEDENQEQSTSGNSPGAPVTKPSNTDVVEDDSSVVSGQSKSMVDMAMVVWRSKKTLPVIVKDLDDYFLKASACGKEIAVMVDMGGRNTSLHHDLNETKGKGNNSARVLNSLSLNWSSRTLQSAKDALENGSSFDPCTPGAHCITLEKLYAEEQILYKAVRDEETTKLELQRKSMSLKKLEHENTDLNKLEKLQLAVENLESERGRLQELVRKTCSSILALSCEELHPQLVTLLSGLIHMWRTMYDCHRVQSHISQQVKHLASHPNSEPTSVYHREATIQLENEVKFWYSSFCRLNKSQREYVKALSRWIQLADCLVDGENRSRRPSTIRSLCDKWMLVLDRLPEQVVSDAIKSFLLVIRSIIMQQEQESIQKRRSDKLEKRLHKDLNSLMELEKKLEDRSSLGDMESGLNPKNPLSIKRAKALALKKRYEIERAKYLNSVQVSRSMTLTNLHKYLPLVLQALTGYSGACAQALETVLNHAQEASNVEQSHVES